MTPFGISIEKNKALRRAMIAKRIFEKDLKETFIRSSGPGGQNVNKVSTCVVLHHLPTGIQVKSQQGRTQGINRYKARCRLIEKIEQKLKEIKQRSIAARLKIKRQNRKRSRATKERMLVDKRKRSEKKLSRRKIGINKIEEY